MNNINLSPSKLIYKQNKKEDMLIKKIDTVTNNNINKNSVNFHSYTASNETKATSTINYQSLLKNDQLNGIQLIPIKKELSHINILERIKNKHRETSPQKSGHSSPSVSILKTSNLKKLSNSEIKDKHYNFLSIATNLEEKFNALLGYHLTNVQNNQDQNKSYKLLKNSDISYYS